MLLVAIASAILAAVAAPPASAHETRPAYLEIEQLEAHQYRFAFRQPQINGRFLGLSVASNCTLLGEPQQTVGSSALEDSWVADCGDAPVTESGLIVQGLERTLIDTLVLIRTKDGEETTQVLTPDSPALTVAGSGVPFVPAYFVLGVEHLIFGIDHVAFLLALMYLLRDTRKLIIAITSFTLAHSI
ncbi:MAG: HupE/UreJ family protein, partial [Pseudomonadales bacterium]